jgi:hypothetical protein
VNLFLRRIEKTGYLLPSVLTGYLWLKGRHPELPGFTCPFLAATGFPCPGCFLTRATAAALNADFAQAAELHLFGPPAAAALIAWSLIAIKKKKLSCISVRIELVFALAGGMLIYWLARAAMYWLLGIRGFPSFPI